MYSTIKLLDIVDSKIYEKIEISDETDDQKMFEDVTIKVSKLNNLGMNKAKFKNSRITQTRFEDCYLRNSEFHNVDLTGSKFINCNLEKAKFKVCTFRYAEFYNCKLNLDEILGNLPTETNIKIAFLKQLYINQQMMVDRESCDKLLIMILNEEKKDLKHRFECKNSYYNDLTSIDRVGALIKYFLNCINDFVWGYGIKIGRLIRFAFLTVLVFGLAIFLSNAEYYNSLNNNIIVKLDLLEAIFSSYINFTSVGMGYYIPYNTAAKILFIFENAFGLVFLGCLVSALYRRISK